MLFLCLVFFKRKGIRIWNWKRKVLRCPYIIYVDEFSSSDCASLCRGGQQNLALNKTAYVSNEYESMPRKNLTDKIILNQIYNARYVRLYIDLYTSNDLVFDEQTTVHVGAMNTMQIKKLIVDSLMISWNMYKIREEQRVFWEVKHNVWGIQR